MSKIYHQIRLDKLRPKAESQNDQMFSSVIQPTTTRYSLWFFSWFSLSLLRRTRKLITFKSSDAQVVLTNNASNERRNPPNRDKRRKHWCWRARSCISLAIGHRLHWDYSDLSRAAPKDMEYDHLSSPSGDPLGNHFSSLLDFWLHRLVGELPYMW